MNGRRLLRGATTMEGSVIRLAPLLLLGCGVLVAAEFPIAPGEDLGTVQQRLRAAGPGSIAMLAPGQYRLTAPLTFTSADSGTCWRGQPGAVIDAGIALNGWQPAGPGRWACPWPGTRPPRSILRDGTPLPPHHGSPVTVSLRDGPGDQRRIRLNPSCAGFAGWLVVRRSWSCSTAWAPFAADGTCPPADGLTWKQERENETMRLDNLPAILVAAPPAPGDPALGWWIDGPAVVVAAEAPPTDGSLSVPGIPTAMVLCGVHDLTLESLTLRGCGWPMPEHGVTGIQAGMIGFTDGGREVIGEVPSALHLSDCERTTLKDLAIEGCDGSGVAIGRHCRETAISGGRLTDLGGGGITVGWRGRVDDLAQDWADATDAPAGTRIEGTSIARCGRLDAGSVAIADRFARNTTIIGNTCSELPYSAISAGFCWDTRRSSQRGGRIADNRITDVCRELADGAGIYLLGWQPGMTVERNRIENVRRHPLAHGAPNAALFLDQGSKGIALRGNRWSAIEGEPLRFNGTTATRNILDDNGPAR